MRLKMVLLVVMMALGLWHITRQSEAQQPMVFDLSDYRTTMFQMLGASVDARRGNQDPSSVELFNAIARDGDALYLAPMIDLAFFARVDLTRTDDAMFNAISVLSDQNFGADWQRYFEWASAHDIALPPHYADFKGTFFAVFIDPEFQRFFPADAGDTARVNLVEPLWGGVAVDGIPSLVNAKQISPPDAAAEGAEHTEFCREDDCSYPADDEYVFGVSIDGDNRAYPLRIMNWHEMFNDVFGMAPLYDAPDGQTVCNFRAPTSFHATARQGENWIQIAGESAGCPAQGWLRMDAITWDSNHPLDALPDVAAGEDALSPANVSAPTGHIAGKPVMLAYCTLCGSGILYDTFVPDLIVNGEDRGATTLEFGSTGLLMRSNKVMYDRNTNTAWNAMTGTPAWGALAATDIQLPILPVVVTDWATWLEEHPDTSVLSLETGFRRNYINGGTYSEYFNNPDFIMFPVWQQDTDEQANKDVVFTLQINDVAKAYPLDTIIPEGVTNDTLGGTNVVIITRETPQRDFFEPGGAAVRAYDRADYTFSQGENRREILDQDGQVWSLTEDALVSPAGEELPRLGGHLAFWFGWYSYFPDTLVYGSD